MKRKQPAPRVERAPIRVGDVVTTTFDPRNGNLERRVTGVTPHPANDCGWAVVLDGGGGCPTCKRDAGDPIGPISATWCGPPFGRVVRRARKGAGE